MANILATGTTAAVSSDFSITTEQTTLLLIGAKAEGALVTIEVKDSAAVYSKIGELTPGNPIQVLSGPGTYRVSRSGNAVSAGCDRT